MGKEMWVLSFQQLRTTDADPQDIRIKWKCMQISFPLELFAIGDIKK